MRGLMDLPVHFPEREGEKKNNLRVNAIKTTMPGLHCQA
jgi:hypothetical protein